MRFLRKIITADGKLLHLPTKERKLINELAKGTQRYPRAKRKLSEKDVGRLDEIFYQLNRMSRNDKQWDELEEEKDKLLGFN